MTHAECVCFQVFGLLYDTMIDVSIISDARKRIPRELGKRKGEGMSCRGERAKYNLFLSSMSSKRCSFAFSREMGKSVTI